MFQNKHFVENVNNEATIEGCEPRVLGNLLKFIYTDNLEPQKYKSVKTLLLADRYNIKQLRVNCEKALSRIITRDNAIEFLCTASNISASILLRSTVKYISRHKHCIVGSAAWDDMVKNHPRVMEEIFKLGF